MPADASPATSTGAPPTGPTPAGAPPPGAPPTWTVRRLVGSPLGRRVAVTGVAVALVVLVLENVSEFRIVQLTAMAYLGIAAGGLTVLTGLSGQLSLGHGAFVAIGAYTTALLYQTTDPVLPLVAVLLVASALTLLCGVVIGVPAARLRGPYIAGATLALAIAVPGLALYFRDTLGGEQGLLVRVPDAPNWVLDAAYFVTGHELSGTKYVGYVGWFSLLLTYFLLANLAGSRVGRRWRAVRDDEVAAALAGIDLGRARVLAFVVSAGCAGLAGSVTALAVRLTAPSGFTLTLSLALLTAIVLGGLGSLTGALIGAALLTFLPQVATNAGQDLGLSDVQAAQLAPLIYGLTMVLVIVFAPRGIVGSVAAAWTRRRERGPDVGDRPSAATPSSRPHPEGGTPR